MKKALLIALLFFPIFLRGQIITTVAGMGSDLFPDGDGGPAYWAYLGYPMDLVFDDSSNYYIIDAYGHALRKVSAVTGIITTIAGDSTQGYAGDNGPATLAKFNEPTGVTIDSAGNLYVCDNSNNRIRKVSVTGIVTTVVGTGASGISGDGGPASSATLYLPTSVKFDRYWNLYITERGNNDVRKVTPSGIITTVAGNGAAGYSGDGGPATTAMLNAPYGLAFDAAGNMYIADAFNEAIRKVSTSGIITTIAGNGTAGFSGDSGPATAAELYSPDEIVFDTAGNLYFSDGDNNRIRKITPSGIITTIAGNGTSGSWGDGGPATAAEFHAPYGLAFDHRGDLYIADNINQLIRKINIGTTNVCSVKLPQILIAPNPCSDVLNIETPFIIKKIEIVKLVGKTFFSESYNSDKLVVNASQLLPGIYFVKINDRFAQKIVKQ